MNIVILTGAGISAESGIPTFRASNGLWEEHRIEEVASPEGFALNPELVHDFYNRRRRHLLSGEVAPNPAHFAIARLQQECKGRVVLVTQNIDNLHERAGSIELIHMHGELLKGRCELCGESFSQTEDGSVDERCSSCGQGGSLRPDIVWFGEMPMAMDEIYSALEAADLFVAIGTSGHVYPAAGFVDMANASNAHTLELNLEQSLVASAFKESRYGPASLLVPAWVESLLDDD